MSNNMFDVDKFIDLVQAYPALYNSTLFEYKNKAHCLTLWNEIAAQMEKTVPECKTVWASLRSSYSRHLNNMENNKKGINQRHKAPWYLADKMTFIDPFITKPNLDRSANKKTEDTNTTTSSLDENSISFGNFKFENPSQSMDDCSSSVTIKCEELETLEAHDQQDQPFAQEERQSEDSTDSERETVDPIAAGFTLKKCRVHLSSADIVKHRRIEKTKEVLKSPELSTDDNTTHRETQQTSINNAPQPMVIDEPKDTPKIVHQQIFISKPFEQVKEIPKENPKATKPMTMIVPRLTTTEEIVKPIQNDTFKPSRVASVDKSLTVRKEVDIEAREKSMVMFFQSILFDLRKLSDRNLRLFKQDVLQDLNKHLDDYENED